MGRIMLATSNSTDEEYGGEYIASADDMSYNNASSGLTANDVQGAIDEVAIIESDNVTRVGNYIVNTSSVKKYGKINILVVNFSASTSYSELPSKVFTTVGTIPAKYRPQADISQIFQFCEVNANSADYKKAKYQIEIIVKTNGDIQVYNYFEQSNISITGTLIWLR